MVRRAGSISVQVLMTAVVVAIIAAGMINLILLRSAAIKRAQGAAAGGALANSGLAAILVSWNAAGGVNCSAVSGYAMTGSSGNCDCRYTSLTGSTTFCAGTGCNPAAGTSPCALTIVAPAPQ